MDRSEGTAGREAALRVVVCDDDPVVRGVVGDLVRDLGGEVIAETDAAIETEVLIDRFEPDVVLLDLGLRHGTGLEVLEAIGRRASPPRVVVFTAYDALAPAPEDGIDVVHKPDFEGLARCLASLAERPQERRRPVRRFPGPGRPVVDDAHAFYRVLNEALPGDVLVCVATGGDDADAVLATLRRSVRAQDRVHRRADGVLLLLVGAGLAGVEALRQRIATELPGSAERLRAEDVGDDPTGAFSRLTS